jgi:hypothetical protein
MIAPRPVIERFSVDAGCPRFWVMTYLNQQPKGEPEQPEAITRQQEETPSGQRLAKLFRLESRCSYVLIRKSLPSNKAVLQPHYLLGEATPASLLQGCLSDMRTALFRIGQRVDKIPFLWSNPIGPHYEQTPNGNWIPNTRLHGCMKDMQRFESQYPTATEFDWEVFRIGWDMGAKWGEGRRSEKEQEKTARNSFKSR